jgi:hypothetical protein
MPLRSAIALLALGLAGASAAAQAVPDAMTPAAPARQSAETAAAKSRGCESCHDYGPAAKLSANDPTRDHRSMHASPAVVLGCTDCHGGNAAIARPRLDGAAGEPGSEAYQTATALAHVAPRDPAYWAARGSANPPGSYTRLNRESPAFIRFINPGDLRVAREACGACHLAIVQASERSLMATSAMLWGGAAYNNGILPFKRYRLGESYTRESEPATVENPVPVTSALEAMGILPRLAPLPAWETVPPADVFRVFERGGRVIGTQFPEIGLPNVSGALQRLDEPGRPDIRQSNRGPGTGNRIAVPLINITKTRLNDPHLWFLGTNEQPGDYRSSGCTACHTPYANDRDPRHSGPYARFGHEGRAAGSDPTIPRDRPGHPLAHRFTRAIPSSQCMVCHMHQPNVFVNSFYGTTMWDYEADAPFMWPKQQKYPSAEEARRILDRNPEEAATRGLWGDPEFLKQVSALNPQLRDTQFADYHGHGWNFRAVFKRDRAGTLVDAENRPVADDDPQKFEKAVHLTSIHLEVGMHCVDCHFGQDAHGNGHLYGEVAAAIEIDCKDCHGTARAYPTLFTSGPAARPGGTDLALLRTPDGRRRFEWRGGRLYQRSALDPAREWEVSLVKDSVTAGHPQFNEKAARAKLTHRGPGGQNGDWGVTPGAVFAHDEETMSCHSCHLSWTTSCAGCHLPIQANWKTERQHYEGGETRNYASYNPQVVREDMFQLGIAGPVKGGKVTPVRSSSALVLSSTNLNRERIYIQQPPIAASGFSSQAFAPHYPHTERKTETKTCTDCHLSERDDNNAIMAQLLLQGTGFVNFVGFNAWVGEAEQVEAVQVTEWEEPQAVIGSYLHRHAYPDWYRQHRERESRLEHAHAHDTDGAANCLQLRGEYLFVAEGAGGLRVYDVASVANKGVSQRIVSAPFSPLGHDTHVASPAASCVALPTNQPIAPARNAGPLMREQNQEQPFHPVYHYAFVTDREQGLIVVNVDTLADGEPRNNFLARALTWNGDQRSGPGVLAGARHLTVGGHFLYVAADAGLVVIDVDDPLRPRWVATLPIADARASAQQFRYLWVTGARGLELVDLTDPERPQHLPEALLPLADARKVYLARTHAYVAAGAEGLAIVDIERPRAPRVQARVQQGDLPRNSLSDTRDVVVGSTNASLFAYVADGVQGLKVLQLTAPDTQPKFYGFSPAPAPQFIAWRPTRSPALALSRGLDRDRAVDETGGQIAVFGRIGSRPFNRREMERLYRREDGRLWTVRDTAGTSYSHVGAPPAGVRR